MAPVTDGQRETTPRGALRLCLWREGRGEIRLFGRVSLAAIAWVIRNRVHRHQSDYVAEVYHPLAFSSMTAPGDPELHLHPANDDPEMMVCDQIAAEVIAGTLPDPTRGSTLYWNPVTIQTNRVITLPSGRAVAFPRNWDPTKVRMVGQIGHHVFAQEFPW